MAALISVIVPVYNVAADLPRCLLSILAQTYSHIEIVAVDDGSLDESGAILDSYAEKYPNVRVIHKENGGVTSARLCGVQEASGEWIGFVDGDDEIEPEMYERLLNNALAYNAQISHCGYQMCFPDGRIHYFYNTGLLAKQDRITALRELLSGSMIEPGLWNKLFHKSLLSCLFHDAGVDMTIKINEDLLMNFRLFSIAETAVFEDRCPYHYIVRSTSASRVKMNSYKIYDPIRVKAIIRQTAPEEIRADAQGAYVNTCINTYNALMFAGTEHRNDLQKVRNLLKQEKESFSLLGKKRALIALLIINVPLIYKLIYGIYCLFFQKRAYS
ncbi:MAG: glycosyltransferase [Lachnospiraceae bacterium]|nr:glycosyltransferase [Lachnospiraceae bacterium]